jgi:Fe-S oxidoreductase
MFDTKDSLTAIISSAIRVRDGGFEMDMDGLHSFINALDAIVVIDRHTNRIIHCDMHDRVRELRKERDAKYREISDYLKQSVNIGIPERLYEINAELDKITYDAIEQLYVDLRK